MHNRIVFICALVLCISCTGKSLIKLKNGDVITAHLYKPVTIDIAVEETFDKPYNQEQVLLDARVVGPSGDTLVFPCFFVSQGKSSSNWQFRFSPRDTGNHSVRIYGFFNGKTEISQPYQVHVIPSEKKGFLSLDQNTHFFLKYDNGEKFRGLGLNVGWEFEPKWDNKQKHTYKMYFEEMHKYGANTIRMWICPWNLPIEWTGVPSHEIFVEEFRDWQNVYLKSDGLTIHPGKTSVTQTDEGQMLITENGRQYLVYQLDSIRKFKMKLYYKGELAREGIKVFCSPDNNKYTGVSTQYSNSWESAGGWRRIFLYADDSLPQPANYLKIELAPGIQRDDLKIAGLQFTYGKMLSKLDCGGLGRYSERNSAKMDSLLQLAEAYNIYLIVTLGYHSVFNPVMDAWGANDEWQRNPYNIKNGGPCEKPADFFSNQTAKDAYKNYLRYFVARWGYHPNVLAWEFWNEIDIAIRTQNIPEKNVIAWHREMAEYLDNTDPYDHPITTSLTHDCCPTLWEIEHIGISQIHRYRPSDSFVEITEAMVSRYNKPHLIGEYAIGWKGPGNDYPEERYEEEFHDAMWRGLFSPAPILPLSWWWDYHYDKNHYFHFAPLARALNVMTSTGGTVHVPDFKHSNGFETYSLYTEEMGIAWIKKTGNNKSLSASFPVPENKEYSVFLLDTRTNKLTSLCSGLEKSGETGMIQIDFSNSNDIALIINYK